MADIRQPGPGENRGMDAAYDIEMEIYVVLGVATMQVSQLLRMGRGAVVELERHVNDPVEIRAHGKLIARGEVVVVEDRLGVSITEVVRSDRA